MHDADGRGLRRAGMLTGARFEIIVESPQGGVVRFEVVDTLDVAIAHALEWSRSGDAAVVREVERARVVCRAIRGSLLYDG